MCIFSTKDIYLNIYKVEISKVDKMVTSLIHRQGFIRVKCKT